MFSRLSILILSLLLSTAAPSWSASSSISLSLFDERYDEDIRLYVRRWWPEYYRPSEWKAQLYQESRFNPGAVSPVGASGLAQFMPATWADTVARLGFPKGASPKVARLAIEAGAYYQGQQRRLKFWPSGISNEERNKFGQAAYNAGAGNIRRAYIKCGGLTWEQTAECLPQITGRHSSETITYVSRIRGFRDKLEAWGFK